MGAFKDMAASKCSNLIRLHVSCELWAFPRFQFDEVSVHHEPGTKTSRDIAVWSLEIRNVEREAFENIEFCV